MQGEVRPPRLVDYFLTVGAIDTNNLCRYKREQKDDDFFGMQSYEVITDICIIPSSRQEDIPPNYECINTTIEGNYGGINAGGYFNFNKFNKHSGPFIAFKRGHNNNKNIDPITNIAIRDVDEYLKINSHLLKLNTDQKSNIKSASTSDIKTKPNIKTKAASSLMSSFKKRLSTTKKIDLNISPSPSDDNNDNNNGYESSDYNLPPPKSNNKNIKWELVSGNLNKGSLGHRLEIWIARNNTNNPKIDPIIDLVIINKSKNEQMPYGFNQVCDIEQSKSNTEISLNEGAAYKDKIYLCFKKRDNKLFNTNNNNKLFEAKIIDRYPLTDHNEFSLSENVAPFCFPRGMEIIYGNKNKTKHKHSHIKRRSIHKRQSAEILPLKDLKFIDDNDNNNYNDPSIESDPSPSDQSDQSDDDSDENINLIDENENEMKIHESRQHTFVLSSETGVRIYGACIIFYEEKQIRNNKLFNGYYTIYIPKAISVLSHYPFYNGFLLFLNDIYCISMSPANRVPLEKYISHFFHGVPLPLCGHPGVEYSIGTKKHIFKLNAKYNLKHISFQFEYLFRCLNIIDIINLIGFILLERQIVLISRLYSIITPCAESLRYLLWPFEYQYSFIPVLPESLARILEAPVPFIFGMHRSFYDQLILPNDVITVDLDNHCITMNKRPINSYKKKYLLTIPKSLKNKLKLRILKYVKLDMLSYNQNIPPIHLNDHEYFNQQAVRLSFVQFFVDIFRFYRNYLSYDDTKTMEMIFNKNKFLNSLPENIQLFVGQFMETHTFQRFIHLRCSAEISKQNDDIITFDYFISKTISSSIISSELNIKNLNQLNNLNQNTNNTNTNQNDNDSSSTTTTNTTNTTNTKKSKDKNESNNSKNSSKKNKEIFIDLECDLITQLNELQLEDPYILFEPYIVRSADNNPSDNELALSPYKYSSFPELNCNLMNKYRELSKRLMINYDNETYKMTETTGKNKKKNILGDVQFKPMHFAHGEPSNIEILKSKSMDESYKQFINDIIIGFNYYIDNINKNGIKYNKESPYIHRKCKTKTMNDTIANFINKIYETWFSIFTHHSINRLSIHTVSPKRDFIKCLIVFENMLSNGFIPTELIMRQLSVIPSHCAMYGELILLDRWMIRLNIIPSLKYLQQIINGNARRSHVEYRKFQQYYNQNPKIYKKLPLPRRTEYSFHDQDPTDSYPFNHCCDCEPESFFDYFLTDLPNKLLLSCKCNNCKHRLSGEEILAGFQNIKKQQFQNINKQQTNKQLVTTTNITKPKPEMKNKDITVTIKQEKSNTYDIGGIPSSRGRSSSDIAKISEHRPNISITKRQSQSIAENPHLPQMIQQKSKQKQKQIQRVMANNNNKNTNIMRRSGQWTTLCPFCSNETVAKIEIFGGIIPIEYKLNLNQYMSYTIMNSNGITNTNNDNRKTFNLFCYERLHERIQRIINNAYPYYPTTKLPYSFPKLTPYDKENTNAKNIKSQDRAIKIIRSKEELFWNVFFYFNLLQLPTEFLFGGNYEFQPNLKYNLAALPHHSWCFIYQNKNDTQTSSSSSSSSTQNNGTIINNNNKKKRKDGLEKYYECDRILKYLHPTLYFSLKPMIKDRLYDALILVLQQRGVIADEKINNKNRGDQNINIKKKKMYNFVMNQPLYRLLGKLLLQQTTSNNNNNNNNTNRINYNYNDARLQSLTFIKSYNKSCERLSYTHKTRLILPQDKGISNNSFANRIQDILLLINDTYHNQQSESSKSSDKSGQYDINPNKFHIILQNHTYSQLLKINDKAQQQINIIITQKKKEKEIKEKEEKKKQYEEQDFLFDTRKRPVSETNITNIDLLSNLQPININKNHHNKKDNNNKRRTSQPININDLKVITKNKNKNNNDELPSKKFWKVVSDSLSPLKRRRHSVEHPCYVPRLRKILNNDFWLTQYRWYIYYFQPRRMKYIYFILLIQEFYKFRNNKNIKISLPQTFSFYFANNNNNNNDAANIRKKRNKLLKIYNLLTFDIMDMNCDTQKKLNIIEYSQFIYYHFVHHMATYKIQFSDKSIVKYIEDCLFEKNCADYQQIRFKKDNNNINIKIFDKMWNAVFRYLHQMTYEQFVIWMNTK